MRPPPPEIMGIFQRLLFAYQIRWVSDTARFRVWLKSRQIGATDYGQALDALIEALEWPHDQVVFSYRVDFSKDILRDVDKWCRVFALAGVELQWEYNATEITFSNGSRIRAIPATPEAVRGARGTLRGDEAAMLRRSTDLWAAAFPVLTSNPRYRAVLTSTPMGKSGLFYNACTSLSDFSRHRTTIHDAIADGLPRDLDQLRRMSGNFSREFECQWGGAGRYYTEQAVIDAGDYDPPHIDSEEWYRVMACDLAKVQDKSAFIIGEVNGLTSQVRALATYQLKGLDYVTQRSIIRDLYHQWGCHSLVIDATAHADTLDSLRTELGADRVAGRRASHEWKALAFPQLKTALELGTIGLNLDTCYQWQDGWQVDHSRPLLAQLAEVEQKFSSATGKYAYTSPRMTRDDGTKDHGDAAFALVLLLDHALAILPTLPAARRAKMTQRAAESHRTRRRRPQEY